MFVPYQVKDFRKQVGKRLKLNYCEKDFFFLLGSLFFSFGVRLSFVCYNEQMP